MPATKSNVKPGDVFDVGEQFNRIVLRVKRGRAKVKRAMTVGKGAYWIPLSELVKFPRVRQRNPE